MDLKTVYHTHTNKVGVVVCVCVCVGGGGGRGGERRVLFKTDTNNINR